MANTRSTVKAKSKTATKTVAAKTATKTVAAKTATPKTKPPKATPSRSGGKASTPARKRKPGLPAPIAAAFRGLRALGQPLAYASMYTDPIYLRASELLADLSEFGAEPTLTTKCGRHHWDEDRRLVSATITRHLYFGDYLYAKWSFELMGEVAGMGSGFWLVRDLENSPISNKLLRGTGLDTNDFDTFPQSD